MHQESNFGQLRNTLATGPAWSTYSICGPILSSTEYDPSKPQFELKTNHPDVHQDGFDLPDFVKEEHSFQVHGGHVTKDDQTNRINGQLLKTMDGLRTTHINDMSACLTQELHPPPRPRVLFEIYCGNARTSEIAAVFGLENRAVLPGHWLELRRS